MDDTRLRGADYPAAFESVTGGLVDAESVIYIGVRLFPCRTVPFSKLAYR